MKKNTAIINEMNYPNAVLPLIFGEEIVNHYDRIIARSEKQFEVPEIVAPKVVFKANFKANTGNGKHIVNISYVDDVSLRQHALAIATAHVNGTPSNALVSRIVHDFSGTKNAKKDSFALYLIKHSCRENIISATDLLDDVRAFRSRMPERVRASEVR